jgi:hypothetical protein
MLTTFDPVASFVSAVNLHRDCPPSLLKALADSHPDWDVWLASFFKEKHGIQSLNTYKKITLGEYWALREKGVSRAIPTMCVLTIKKDKQLHPLHAKSRNVVLGNHEDQVWSKSKKFAPVLRQDSLCFLTSMAVLAWRPLRQGNCKNAFCQVIIPPNKITIVHPPSGNSEAEPDKFWLLKRTLYGCGARLDGSKSNAFNLILRLFLYHFLHTMSSWHHKSIHNNTSNQQTPPPQWWSRSPLLRCGFDDTTPPEGWAALRMFVLRPLLKDFVWFIKLM